MTFEQLKYIEKHLTQRLKGIEYHNTELKRQVKLNNQLARDTKKHLNKIKKLLNGSFKAN